MNIALSELTELLGGRLLETAALPEDNDMRREDGELEKCIFHFSL